MMMSHLLPPCRSRHNATQRNNACVSLPAMLPREAGGGGNSTRGSGVPLDQSAACSDSDAWRALAGRIIVKGHTGGHAAADPPRLDLRKLNAAANAQS